MSNITPVFSEIHVLLHKTKNLIELYNSPDKINSTTQNTSNTPTTQNKVNT